MTDELKHHLFPQPYAIGEAAEQLLDAVDSSAKWASSDERAADNDRSEMGAGGEAREVSAVDKDGYEVEDDAQAVPVPVFRGPPRRLGRDISH